MPARLFCKTGEFAGASFEIGTETTIGRGPDGGASIPSEVVSGRHARIFFDESEGSYFLEDLGSSNGTKLDGLTVNAPVKLGALHVVTLADRIDLIYHAVERSAAAPATLKAEVGKTEFAPVPVIDLPPEQEDEARRTRIAASPFIGLPPEPEAAGRETQPEDIHPPAPSDPGPLEAPTIVEPPRFALDIARLDDNPKTFLLIEGENTVGRSPECTIMVDAQSVSRQHAVLTVRGGRITVRDFGSRNKTFLNGNPVDAETEIQPGASLRFGIDIEATLRRA